MEGEGSMSETMEVNPQALNLACWLRPGDTVWCSQGLAEPLTLTEALVKQAPSVGGLSVFLGIVQAPTFSGSDRGSLRLLGYVGIVSARGLVDAGYMEGYSTQL